MQKRESTGVRITTLESQGTESDLCQTTVAQRIDMMWQLALDAWMFKGEPVVESRLPRHVARVRRNES